MATSTTRRMIFKDIFIYFLVGFILCFLSVIFTSFYSYRTIYNQAVDEATAAIQGAVKTERLKLTGVATSYGSWNLSVENVLKNFNKTWIDENILEDAKRNFSVSLVTIFNDDKEFKTAYSSDDKIATVDKPAPSEFSSSILALKNNTGKEKGISSFVKIGQKIYLVSATKIQPTSASKENLQSAFLLIARPFDEAYLDDLSNSYKLSKISLIGDPNTFNSNSGSSLSIDSDGKTVAYITWSPKDTAKNILFTLIPTGLAVILILCGIGIVISRRIVVAANGYNSVLEELTNSARELAEAKSKSDSSGQVKSRFLSLMSHEIKTPMNGLMGMISLLKETELNETQAAYVNTMEISADSLIKLVDNILDFSKLESGEISIVYGEVNVRKLIAEIHGLLLPIGMQKKLKFDTHFAEEVPLIVRTDAIRLRQILLHLVTNALKFTSVGSVKINVTSTELSNNRAEIGIQVIDTGIGIPDGIRETLFDDFFHVGEGKETRPDGAGLGLSIVKNLVNLMQAKLGVESKLGQGSVFWIQIEVDVVARHQATPPSITINQQSQDGSSAESAAATPESIQQENHAQAPIEGAPTLEPAVAIEPQGVQETPAAAPVSQTEVTAAPAEISQQEPVTPEASAPQPPVVDVAAPIADDTPATIQQTSVEETTVSVAQTTQAPQNPEPSSTAPHQISVLVVSPDSEEGSLTHNLLEKIGNTVTKAPSSPLAASLVGTQNFDAIFVQLSEEETREGGPDLSPTPIKIAMEGRVPAPIIAIVREGQQHDLSQFDRVINTPITSGKLQEVIDGMFQSKNVH